jgi:hypothetical protein
LIPYIPYLPTYAPSKWQETAPTMLRSLQRANHMSTSWYIHFALAHTSGPVTNTLRPQTNPPYKLSCATSLYSDFPTTNSTFRSCCSGNTVADYASPGTSESCWQYCNATSREQEAAIYSCMQPQTQTSGIWCEGTLNSDGSFSGTSAATRIAGNVSKGGVVLLALAMMGIMGM